MGFKAILGDLLIFGLVGGTISFQYQYHQAKKEYKKQQQEQQQ